MCGYKTVSTLSFDSHIPEDDIMGRNIYEESHIFTAVLFLLLCSCWSKYCVLFYCAEHG